MQNLKTERLLLRPFCDDDTAIHTVVFSDPEVCRYYCGRTRTEDETREWLIHRRWQARSPDELGFLAVIRKADQQLLGLVALQLGIAPTLALESDPPSPFVPLAIELSYAFGQAFQRQGYATEACRALVAYGFETLRLPRLVNGVAEENQRSNRMCERLGFERRRNLHPADGGFVWVLDNITLPPTADHGR